MQWVLQCEALIYVWGLDQCTLWSIACYARLTITLCQMFQNEVHVNKVLVHLDVQHFQSKLNRMAGPD
jgi:hypothetical protein